MHGTKYRASQNSSCGLGRALVWLETVKSGPERECALRGCTENTLLEVSKTAAYVKQQARPAFNASCHSIFSDLVELFTPVHVLHDE